MSLAFLNIRGLQKHIDELRSFVSERGIIHIMAINETKLSKYSPDCLVSINDFAVERKDRNEDGGGVAIYIRNTINYKLVENLPQHTLELMCVEIVPKRAKPFFLVCWYRPPSSTVDKFHELENIISYFETFQKEIIFLGDTNCDLLKAVQTSVVTLFQSICEIFMMHLGLNY